MARRTAPMPSPASRLRFLTDRENLALTAVLAFYNHLACASPWLGSEQGMGVSKYLHFISIVVAKKSAEPAPDAKLLRNLAAVLRLNGHFGTLLWWENSKQWLTVTVV